MNIIFLKTFLIILAASSPGLFLFYKMYKDMKKNKFMSVDDVEMIRFIKQQEMIEGMRYGKRDKTS